MCEARAADLQKCRSQPEQVGDSVTWARGHMLPPHATRPCYSTSYGYGHGSETAAYSQGAWTRGPWAGKYSYAGGLPLQPAWTSTEPTLPVMQVTLCF